MKTTRYLQVGLLLPSILTVLLLADVFMRVTPPKWLAFRALEGVQRRTPSCMGPFGPNVLFRADNSYGDRASLGNMPAMRQYRSVTFATDSLGFHNPENLGGVPCGILIGDSFAISSEVPETKTFAAQLSRLQGCPVYNAGEDEALTLAPLRSVARRLKMQRGFVVYEFLERHLNESPPFLTPTGKVGLRSYLPSALGAERWDEWRLPVWHDLGHSPMQALS